MTEAYSDWGVPVWTLGDRMAKAATVAGLSVNDMAARFGVTRHTVGNWINGRTKPTPEAQRQWADLCRVPLAWLVTGEASAASMQAYRLALVTARSPELSTESTGEQDAADKLIMRDGSRREPGSVDPKFIARGEDWEACAIRDSNPEPAD